MSTFNLQVHHAQQSHKTQIIFNSSATFSIRDLNIPLEFSSVFVYFLRIS